MTRNRNLKLARKLLATSDAIIQAAADQHMQADSISDPEAKREIHLRAEKLMAHGCRIEKRGLRALVRSRTTLV